MKNLGYHIALELSLITGLFITLSIWGNIEWGKEFVFGPAYMALFLVDIVLSMYCHITRRIYPDIADDTDLPPAGNWRLFFGTLETLVLVYFVCIGETITLSGAFLHIALTIRTLTAIVVLHRWWAKF